jgi:uncharacterized LabA/DUF88 family protein
MNQLLYKSWMLFVDGENLTLRAQKLANQTGRQIPEGAFYRKDVFLWFPSGSATEPRFQTVPRLAERALRSYYYTSLVADFPAIEVVKEQLRAMRFSPEVFKRDSGQVKAKGVDIALTKDMLSHAFRNNYEIAVLVAGDGDYLPLVEEVKRLGKLVYVWFFEAGGGGLNPALKLAADHFADIGLLLTHCTQDSANT